MISYTTENHIARITLNRPEKRNALDRATIQELHQALLASHNARAVVLTGAGPDFCSGADLAALRTMFDATPLEHMDDARQLADIFLAIRHHPRPVIATVRGRALAGGCGLATACDVVLAEESAQFGYPEIHIGFVPAMVMAILRRAVSEKIAFHLITTGEIIPALTAFELGLITRLYPDDSFEAESEDYIRKLAAKPPDALTLSKRLLYHIDAQPFETALDAGIQTNALARLTPDFRRGIERFLRKLDPATDTRL